MRRCVVVHDARLLARCARQLLRAGFDTRTIARRLNIAESQIWNAWARFGHD